MFNSQCGKHPQPLLEPGFNHTHLGFEDSLVLPITAAKPYSTRVAMRAVFDRFRMRAREGIWSHVLPSFQLICSLENVCVLQTDSVPCAELLQTSVGLLHTAAVELRLKR